MKIFTTILPVFLFSIFSIGFYQPTPVAALSCLSPIEYIPTIVEEGEHTIFSGEIVAAHETDGNVTQLEVDVAEVLQGQASEVISVQYEYDETWGYLCAGAPSKVGKTETFIIREGDGTPFVIYSFSQDSDLFEVLTDALASTTSTPILPPTIQEDETERDLMFQVLELLNELLTLLRLR